jgi:CRP-like cAMP-binding protein
VALFHEKLLLIARPVSFPKGAQLVRQGEPSRGAFMIRQGEVEAEVELPGGGRLAVARLGEGALFGEMALIENGVCTASVVARSDLEGWFVGRDDFRAMVASRDDAALMLQREITRILAGKLRALNAKVREHPSAEDRPARASQKQAPGEPKKPEFAWRAFLPLLQFFDGFDADEVDELVAGGRVFELARGATLFAPGDPSGDCYVVLRGALEIYSSTRYIERRIAIAGPGELVGYLAALEGVPHGGGARIREGACLLEIRSTRFLEIYNGTSSISVRLQRAIHKSLLRALGRTNTQLSRLISHARLSADRPEAVELEKALHSQIVQSSSPEK